jgi:hypothetical protein
MTRKECRAHFCKGNQRAALGSGLFNALFHIERKGVWRTQRQKAERDGSARLKGMLLGGLLGIPARTIILPD